MNQPSLDLTIVGTKTSDETIQLMDSSHVGAKTSYPKIHTANGIIKAQGKSAKRLCTRGSGIKPNFNRLVIELI